VSDEATSRARLDREQASRRDREPARHRHVPGHGDAAVGADREILGRRQMGEGQGIRRAAAEQVDLAERRRTGSRGKEPAVHCHGDGTGVAGGDLDLAARVAAKNGKQARRRVKREGSRRQTEKRSVLDRFELHPHPSVPPEAARP
jgi:hypothetical protein